MCDFFVCDFFDAKYEIWIIYERYVFKVKKISIRSIRKKTLKKKQQKILGYDEKPKSEIISSIKTAKNWRWLASFISI